MSQELKVAQVPGGALLKGLLVRDCPLIVRLAKGEEKNMMFARVFSLASNVGFWIGIVRIAVLNRSGFLMFFYITGAMLSYTAMVFAMPHKKEQIAGQQA